MEERKRKCDFNFIFRNFSLIGAPRQQSTLRPVPDKSSTRKLFLQSRPLSNLQPSHLKKSLEHVPVMTGWQQRRYVQEFGPTILQYEGRSKRPRDSCYASELRGSICVCERDRMKRLGNARIRSNRIQNWIGPEPQFHKGRLLKTKRPAAAEGCGVQQSSLSTISCRLFFPALDSFRHVPPG